MGKGYIKTFYIKVSLKEVEKIHYI